MATGIGETLRAARRQQGVALSDAAAETRVREAYLAALEEEDFAALGGDVYVKGFLRSYARFLRLDPEPLLQTYRREYEHPTEDLVPLAVRQPVERLATERRPTVVVAAGVAALVLVLLALVGIFGGGDEPSEDELAAAPPPVTEPAHRRTEPQASATQDATERPEETEPPKRRRPSADPTETVEGDEVEVVLETTDGESWMRVTVDGVTQFESIQPAGESASYSGQEIVLRIGDAGAVQVTVNGAEVGKLGKSREVVNKTYVVEESA